MPIGRIKHVVIVVQENRSFENVFAGFPGADAPMYGSMHDRKKVRLEPIPFEEHEIEHNWATALTDWDHGKMDGFDLNAAGASGKPAGAFAYSYLEHSEIQPYWTMAKEYVLADHMFPTMFGESFTAHLTLVAGTADLTPTLSLVNDPSQSIPWGCDDASGTTTWTVNAQRVVAGGGPFPCFTQFRTMADTLDAAHLSWRYYAPVVGGSDSGQVWSSFDAIRNVRYGPDWRRIVSPPQQILADAAHKKLAAVTWVIPDFLWSDHPYAGKPYGPSWVAAVVNAIGNSPAWRSTAIVVLWDDWGGFFDNVPPPHRDFRGLGIRVGCIIVSPYVRPHVSHTVYEFGSVLKFVEQVFGLPPLGSRRNGYTDRRATSLADSFDFTMNPRRFKTIPAPYPASFFLSHAPSLRAPDDY